MKGNSISALFFGILLLTTAFFVTKCQDQDDDAAGADDDAEAKENDTDDANDDAADENEDSENGAADGEAKDEEGDDAEDDKNGDKAEGDDNDGNDDKEDDKEEEDDKDNDAEEDEKKDNDAEEKDDDEDADGDDDDDNGEGDKKKKDKKRKRTSKNSKTSKKKHKNNKGKGKTKVTKVERLRCQDRKGRHLPIATVCEDHFSSEFCHKEFPLDTANKKGRPPKCDLPELEKVAYKCARHCKICCELAAHGCGDDPNYHINCHSRKHLCTKMVDMMNVACATTCGTCDKGTCKDEANGCIGLRAMCHHGKDFVHDLSKCARSCKYCKPKCMDFSKDCLMAEAKTCIRPPDDHPEDNPYYESMVKECRKKCDLCDEPIPYSGEVHQTDETSISSEIDDEYEEDSTEVEEEEEEKEEGKDKDEDEDDEGDEKEDGEVDDD